MSNAGVIRYLYALKHCPSWGEGNLVVETERVENHKHAEKESPPRFFDLEGSENISAVLWGRWHGAKICVHGACGPYPDNVGLGRIKGEQAPKGVTGNGKA
ncbi:hypothetical protein ACVIIV_003057 [Bradyrhizobium sp. USDA 4354]